MGCLSSTPKEPVSKADTGPSNGGGYPGSGGGLGGYPSPGFSDISPGPQNFDGPRADAVLPLPNPRLKKDGKHLFKFLPSLYNFSSWQEYAVKAQPSLAPLSRLAGSRGLMHMRTNIVYFRELMLRLYRRE